MGVTVTSLAPGTVLACPECGSTDDLGSMERIIGRAGLVGVTVGDDGTPKLDWDGETDVWWDSSTTTAYNCEACDWTGDLSALVPSADEEDSDD